MFDDLTAEEWARWERAERDYHAHPALYRMRLVVLFAEGFLVAFLLFAVITLLVAACIANPLQNLRLIIFLVCNLFASVVAYCSALSHRPWAGLPELGEKDWPRLHEFVRKTASAVGAPRIHRVFLAPDEFNACVAVAFPLVPCMRRNVLVLGYPLLATLGVRGLRGVIAHEAGHVVHRDTIHGGALLHVRVFWSVVELGVFTWVLIPWRRSYLRRIDRLMSPLERARELAADRAIEERFGQGTLRETLVSLELRGVDANLSEIFEPIAETEDASPAAAIREALRRTLPADTIRRRIERALQSINPPMEEHPPLAVRVGTSDAAELIPYASLPQDTLEVIFGGADALDGFVNPALKPVLTAVASDWRNQRMYADRHLAELPEENASPDELIERFLLLRSLKRTDEADRLFIRARALYPDNAALEAIKLSEALAHAASAEAGAPFANRLEQLIAREPMLRIWAEDPLFLHYLETGAPDRIKHLLDLRRQGERTLSRRLGAKLRPTDDIRPLPLSKEERANLAKSFEGRSIREFFAVRRLYGGTGVVSIFYVVRWNRLILDAGSVIKNLDDTFDDAHVVAGTRALFNRFAELGIDPIPVGRDSV